MADPIRKMFMPLTSIAKLTIEPYNNHDMKDFQTEVLKYIDENTIIVEDAYYLDDKSKALLRKYNIMYFPAINPIRFKEVWTECEKCEKCEKDGRLDNTI